jgi:hypothetical protein
MRAATEQTLDLRLQAIADLTLDGSTASNAP